MQAHCRMFDSRIERWVVHSVDGELRPVRSFVSQHVDGEFAGEGWFRMSGTGITGHALVSGEERDFQVPLDGWPDYFVPHAVAADSWIVAGQRARDGAWRQIRRGWTTSTLADGASGPEVLRHVGIRARWEGQEVIEVPAGTFEVDHFVVSVRAGVEEHLWVSADDWMTLVQLRSDRLATTYVLTEFVEDDPWS